MQTFKSLQHGKLRIILMNNSYYISSIPSKTYLKLENEKYYLITKKELLKLGFKIDLSLKNTKKSISKNPKMSNRLFASPYNHERRVIPILEYIQPKTIVNS